MDDTHDRDQVPFPSERPAITSSIGSTPGPHTIYWKKPLIFFVCTVLTTLISGAIMEYPRINVVYLMFSYPSIILKGVPFSLSMLSILMAHEMGH